MSSVYVCTNEFPNELSVGPRTEHCRRRVYPPSTASRPLLKTRSNRDASLPLDLIANIFRSIHLLHSGHCIYYLFHNIEYFSVGSTHSQFWGPIQITLLYCFVSLRHCLSVLRRLQSDFFIHIYTTLFQNAACIVNIAIERSNIALYRIQINVSISFWTQEFVTTLQTWS